jgi:hypothetical protein
MCGPRPHRARQLLPGGRRWPGARHGHRSTRRRHWRRPSRAEHLPSPRRPHRGPPRPATPRPPARPQSRPTPQRHQHRPTRPCLRCRPGQTRVAVDINRRWPNLVGPNDSKRRGRGPSGVLTRMSRVSLNCTTFDVTDPRIVPANEAVGPLRSPWRQLLGPLRFASALLPTRAG